jgi:predicted MPP superfamily phosphohydrolase
MEYLKHVRRRYHTPHFYSLILIFVFLLTDFPKGFSQVLQDQHRIFFISDVQAPMQAEKIILKPYRNEEARDSLFADILRRCPANLFLLGDLESYGSREEAWAAVDAFVASLEKIHTGVYAIPGNHEYMGASTRGPDLFLHRFPEKWLHGYSVTLDSIAIVLLNSNFGELGRKELSKQLGWYASVMDSLDTCQAIKAIIVCIHHPPRSNSEVVGSNRPVEEKIVPAFERSKKAKLFISGHSHNLEYFAGSAGKHFLVIGGGGGIAQPLLPMEQRVYSDLLKQDEKPLYFYVILERNRDCLKLIARGFKRDFRFFDSEIGTIILN